MTVRRQVLVTVSLSMLVMACGGSASPPPNALDVSLSEYAVAASSSTAAAGKVTFTIKNAGTVTHEFVVLKTDVGSDKLPSAEGKVDEEDPALAGVDEVEDIAAGTTATLAVDLPAGHYALICNLPGHYVGGMHASLDVAGSN